MDSSGKRSSAPSPRRTRTAVDLAESAAAAIIRGDASARHAELVTLVSQLVIHNTRMDEASAARGRDVYDRVARQIYLLAAVLVAGVVVGGAILLRNADLRHGARPGQTPGAVLAHADAAGDAADRVRASCTTSSARSSRPSA